MRNIKNVVDEFNTIPFLFVGSGLSRRYLGLPNWKELLTHFAKRLDNDEFVFQKYRNKIRNEPFYYGEYPKIAQLIENDFNEKWFNDQGFRRISSQYVPYINKGVSPFKVEIASYIANYNKIRTNYLNETKKFKQMCRNSIAGIITTNYDLFLENNIVDFKKYIGQNELIFNSIQGIGEIYKIHGSIDCPESIVINEKDYKEFQEKSMILVAKLMTIFAEYPIIFIGYSLSDNNIRNIMKSLIDCLNEDQLNLIQDRFVFVEYKQGKTDIGIENHSFNFGDKIIGMTKIETENFGLIYDNISKKKNKLPAGVLRVLKEQLYEYSITNAPTDKISVANIDDDRISDDDLVLSIAKVSDLPLKGLRGISADEWYRDIVLDDLTFQAEDMLKILYPSLIKQNNILPINKYLYLSKADHPDLMKNVINMYYDDLINKTTKKYRDKKHIKERTVQGVLNQFDYSAALNYIACLHENEIEVSVLENLLVNIFKNKEFYAMSQGDKSNVRRLVRIYDYLKYNKKIKER